MTIQEQIEAAVVGESFELPLLVEGTPQQPVRMHCTETLTFNDKPCKRFIAFSHNIKIAEVQATKEGETWVPR